GPISGLKDDSVQETNMHDLTADSVDFHPVAWAYAIRAHQDKPAEEANNEILERDGQPGAGQRQNGRQLAGRSKQHQQDQRHTADLQRDACHGTNGMAAPAFRSHARNDQANQPLGEEDDEKQGRNPRSSFDESKSVLLLSSLHERVPLPVKSVELSEVGG